jgi:hypothetical protein
MGVLGYQPINTKISLIPKLIGRRLAKNRMFNGSYKGFKK